MKILHLMLASFYIDHYNYQENALPRQNKGDGNDVEIIASCFTFNAEGKGTYLRPSKYENEDGIPVIRLQYRKIFSHGILRRVRTYPGVYKLIEAFHPDVIMFHGCSSWELLTVAKYKKKHPSVRLYVDNHADQNNSGQGFVSNVIQHRCFYKPILHRALQYIDKVFYLSIECGDFLRDVYSIPDKHLEFYPLGGKIITAEERKSISLSIQTSNGVDENNIIFCHSGKMDAKKRTAEIIRAFSKIDDTRMRLWLFGSLADDIKSEILALIDNDNRISFMGWKKPEELTQYLCATDMYIQLGGQSATMQNALCCGCAIMLYPHKSHEPYVQHNGFFIRTEEDMILTFNNISSNPEQLKRMQSASFVVARKLLDYKKLAARLYE